MVPRASVRVLKLFHKMRASLTKNVYREVALLTAIILSPAALTESASASPYRLRRCGVPSSSRTAALRNTRFYGAWISPLNAQPARPPVNASRTQLPAPAHDLGPVWVANPSPYETFIHNTLPV